MKVGCYSDTFANPRGYHCNRRCCFQTCLTHKCNKIGLHFNQLRTRNPSIVKELHKLPSQTGRRERRLGLVRRHLPAQDRAGRVDRHRDHERRTQSPQLPHSDGSLCGIAGSVDHISRAKNMNRIHAPEKICSPRIHHRLLHLRQHHRGRINLCRR